MPQPVQTGILQPVPLASRYLHFSIADASQLPAALQRLSTLADGESVVVGLGPATVAALGATVPGLHELSDLGVAQAPSPVTPVALWCWLRSEDHGDLVFLSRQIEKAVTPGLRLDKTIEAFRYGRGPNGHGRDLTGYEDGIENPTDDAALAAAVLQGAGDGLDGSSFVAVQQWVHDFDTFEALGQPAQDHTFGRRRSDSEEMDDAPASAHVKRTAQEDFDPEAFVLRRSMPWAAHSTAGLIFVAFGRSFDAYEALLRRMAGLDDGVVDALYQFSTPVSGCFLWCPPVRRGTLDLRHLGL